MKYHRLAPLLVVALLAAGCSQPPPPTTESVAPVVQENVSIEVPSLVPNRLVIGVTQELEPLDPGTATNAATAEVLGNIFHGLVSITPEGRIFPELCERYEISEDGLVYTFYLRKDAKFHNGALVRAQDVAYTFRRMMGQTEDQTEPLREELAKIIREITVPDQTTVQFALHKPDAAFLSLCMAGILPQNSGATVASMP
ncbi:MAG TPA: hypothetical protein GX499_09065, partial [Clostridiales bacterium]|nr:hypothetical protein [Clostridiales bacterium]